jgi:hypothetical protein
LENTPSRLQQMSRSLASSCQPQHPGERGEGGREGGGGERKKREREGDRERQTVQGQMSLNCEIHKKEGWLRCVRTQLAIKCI